MEIDKAINASVNDGLKAKYQSAMFVIRRALQLYSIEELAFSFNGGKDSTVLLHLLRAGHFLHENEKSSINARLTSFPIRTIYFESPSAFPEINSFTFDTASSYRLRLDIITSDFKSGLENLLHNNPIRAIFLGVRFGDPTAVGQEQFSPSSLGWPPFMRVNPILDWSYRDVWAFILTCKLQYCTLYDQGYTSIGSIHDTLPNSLLSVVDSTTGEERFEPAYMLSDGRLERAGRIRKISPTSGQLAFEKTRESDDTCRSSTFKATSIAVGDEILFGTIEDKLGHLLRKKIHSIGWSVPGSSVVRNDVGLVAKEVDRQRSANDVVFIYGAVGLLTSDVTLAGVAKSFGVRLAPKEKFEENDSHFLDHFSHEIGSYPEGITEFLHHKNLQMPLMKCENVIILTSTNGSELDKEWDCLMDVTNSLGLLGALESYKSKSLKTCLFEVEFVKPLSDIRLEYPDILIGCYRESRKGPYTIYFKSTDNTRIEAAAAAFLKHFAPESFSHVC